MSTGDNTIRVVRVDGLLLVGDYQMGVLLQPRVLMSQKTPDGQQMLFPAELVGQPKEVMLPANVLMWIPEDEGLINAYRENVTGLVLAKTVPPNLSLVKG